MKNENRIWILMGKQLSGSIMPAEVQELENLLILDPELWYSHELLQAVISLDDVPEEFIREFRSLLDSQAEPEKLNDLMLTQLSDDLEVPLASYLENRKYLGYAAILIVALLVGAGIVFMKPATTKNSFSSMNEIVAPKGSKTQITLADGTAIWLNAGSRLLYPKNFSMENREVYLTGEAYFTVVHNEKYSFVVHIPEADIIDLGTTFNVKAYRNNSTAETTLIKGSLEVVLKDNSSQKILMRPNEKLTLHKRKDRLKDKQGSPDKIFEVTSIVPFSVTNDVVETGWVEDKLIFRNELFKDLATEMERRYNVTIMIRDEEVRNYEMTGIFKSENIEEALKTLQFITPFKFKINNDQILIDK